MWKRILRLALPSILTFSSMTLTGMLTLIIVGRLGPTAIAVVGICNIFMYNVWALFAGLNESINFLVSQNFGENKMLEGNKRMQAALLIALALDVIWIVACIVLPREILVMLGANRAIVTAGTPYLGVRMFSFAFTMFTVVFFAYMRAVGDTRTPMIISIITNGLLIVLTYFLTYGALGWRGFGLQGAAWSMVITEGLGFVLSLIVYYGWYAKRFATRTWYGIEWSRIRLLAKESIKLSVMELSMSLGMLIFTMCITRLGTTAVAANEIALNILSLGFMPANGFGAAATVIVGQDIGAGAPAQARKGGLLTAAGGLIFMALFSIFLWLFALPVSKIYTSDPAVYLLSISLIHIASFIQLFDGANIIFAGGLRGVGDTTYLYRMSLISNWLVFIPLTLILVLVVHLGQVGAWISLATLIVLLGVGNATRYLTLDWGSVSVIRSGPSVEQG
ncbi:MULTISPECIES: MATE family efflux transporter [Alicyclobacillus]|uniref:Probable multidrug resistance protein NorM n=1 Tax=Alicyclobacillus acidoterrestris (strain ATCC 49025 / DSM 3922 / CIP 106132 / NCIMB 13137 / GD3B) TaxID=1356854 RepID=A0A9E6ZPB1_ALIAG|nr:MULTISPECIES: MATE family efflux transporter [Alicyclobacillus]UNO50711.1 MATE family efflux transporter [Alicyclobacillus acidoterrestris]